MKLELGHRAQVRKKPTVEGFTHDWMVFVRGAERSNIQHFVEKVVFHLHESFPRPKRGKGGISFWGALFTLPHCDWLLLFWKCEPNGAREINGFCPPEVARDAD